MLQRPPSLAQRSRKPACDALCSAVSGHVGCHVDRLKAIVAHLRAQLPGTTLLLAGLLPRGFAGDRTGQWQTSRAGVDERDWPNPFRQVRVGGLVYTSV